MLGLTLWEGSMKMKLLYTLALVLPFGLVVLVCIHLVRMAWGHPSKSALRPLPDFALA